MKFWVVLYSIELILGVALLRYLAMAYCLYIAFGLILGDLFISRKNNENASIRFEQSIIHREYLEHLFERFKYLFLFFLILCTYSELTWKKLFTF